MLHFIPALPVWVKQVGVVLLLLLLISLLFVNNNGSNSIVC